MQYYNEFNDEMGQLFAKIGRKVEDAKTKIDKYHEAVNLKAALAG
jgi:hypothetical protein